MDAPLEPLLAKLPGLFPASSPFSLTPSAKAFAPHSERFSGGHAARWFAASDGEEGQRPFADAHYLCSLAEALEAMQIADELRAQHEGYWVLPHWLAIASDGSGHHFMIDDANGNVLSVAHDDEHVEVIAPSAAAWLGHLIDGHAESSVVWDKVFGLIEVAELEQIHAAQASGNALRPPELSPKQKLRGALGAVLVAIIMGCWIWFLETHR